jgi:hypothetical protein
VIDATALRGRLVALADLHHRQLRLSVDAGDRSEWVAARYARTGIEEAIAVVDAMAAGHELAPLPDVDATTPTLFGDA